MYISFKVWFDTRNKMSLSGLWYRCLDLAIYTDLFTLKLLLFSRYLSFCLDFLVIYKNGLISKIRLILKFMTSQPGYQTIAIRILPNIPRSKGNQTMKFGQLIEYNMRNSFVEKSYTKCAGETIPTILS